MILGRNLKMEAKKKLTRNVFVEETKKLFCIFYITPSKELLNYWYTALKDFPEKDFIRVIDKYCKSENRTPYLSDIYKLLKPEHNFI